MSTYVVSYEGKVLEVYDTRENALFAAEHAINQEEGEKVVSSVQNEKTTLIIVEDKYKGLNVYTIERF